VVSSSSSNTLDASAKAPAIATLFLPTTQSLDWPLFWKKSYFVNEDIDYKSKDGFQLPT
jgi:hypothetical protein